MEFFKTKLQVNFLGARYVAGLLSLVAIVLSAYFLWSKGLAFGLDFTGGTVLEVQYPQEVDIESIREQLEQAGYEEAIVQQFGSAKDILIRLPLSTTDEATVSSEVFNVLQRVNPAAQLLRSDVVGAQMGSELAQQGLLAVLVAWIGTMIYIAFRFEWRYALGAALALAHDPLVILGVFALFQIEFDLPTLAGVLAVIGYSLNDTIVVFDRVKENFVKQRGMGAYAIMNLSLNETLSRTIMTSFMTLLVVLALLVYGGPTLFGFSLALSIGIVIGTYSSIYVAGALALWLGIKR